MTDEAKLALQAFTRAVDDFLRTQELIHEAKEKSIRPGLLELLKNGSETVSATLQRLRKVPEFAAKHAFRYRSITFFLLPSEGGAFMMAAIPEDKVCIVQ
jgi:hypothetical protein